MALSDILLHNLSGILVALSLTLHALVNLVKSDQDVKGLLKWRTAHEDDHNKKDERQQRDADRLDALIGEMRQTMGELSQIAKGQERRIQLLEEANLNRRHG